MSSGLSRIATNPLPSLLVAGTAIGQSDHELVKRFAVRRGERDEVAEAAFAALVSRYGPMVLRVCLAALGDRHDAEDAFQATFLVLASRAASIRSGDSIGAWLHGVALRVALRARSRSSHRRLHERRRAEQTDRVDESADENPSNDEDLNRVLQEEIGRLSEKYRVAVVLCYLEGLTHDRAADRLGCPVGTIRSRLATARERLKRRLIRRGLTPAISAGWLASTSGEGAELIASGVRLPTSLVESVVRGAMQVGVNKAALGGLVSSEAVALMKGVTTTMMTTKLVLATTSFLAVGLLTAGVGVKAYSALGFNQGLPVAGSNPSDLPAESGQKPIPSPPPASDAASKHSDFAKAAEEARKTFLRRSEEQVTRLVREFQEKEDATRDAILKAKTPEERIAFQKDRANPAAYAGALLQSAEEAPGTPQAEKALVWIGAHMGYGSMAERAKEMLARDHSPSGALEPVFRESQVHMSGSRATERLFRDVLSKNPDRKLRCLACYHLARFLEAQALAVRVWKGFDPERLKSMGAAIQRESWGYDFEERLSKLDAGSLEQDAVALYERLIEEFGDIPLPHPLSRPTGDRLLPGRPETFGEAGRIYLHVLRDLAIGRPAPEIDGVDLDGKPMKLSDYRGKVVALYFCGPTQLSASGTGKPAFITETVRAAALHYQDEPFVVLGVATTDPGHVLERDATRRDAERESFQSLLRASELPARFWWDRNPDGTPGPIQSAWNGGMYLIDRQGVIRYREVLARELFEKAVGTLLQERVEPDGHIRLKD